MFKPNKKTVVTTATCALLGVLAIGGTLAYLTDTEGAVNTFTVGKVQVDLEEPNWDPYDPTDPTDQPDLPNEVKQKDPQIENTGNNDAWVFVEVKVPVRKYTPVSDAGVVGAETTADVATFGKLANAADVTSAYTKMAADGSAGLGTDWILVNSAVSTANNTYSTYLLGYKNAVAPGAKTPAAFDAIKIANFQEGALDEMAMTIPVKAYAIQSSSLTGIDYKNPQDKAGLKKIYDIFAAQNPTAISSTTSNDAGTAGAKDLKGNDL